LELKIQELPPSTLTNIDGGPLGVLAAGLAAATTKVEDVDGEPPGGCWRQVRQRPPPKLKTLMEGPYRVLAVGPTAATTEAENVDGGPPRGCWRQVR
jgi:hypothetical protein